VTPDLARAEFRKSSYSGGNGQCIEVAVTPVVIAVRDSKKPGGDVLVFNSGFDEFLNSVKNGSFKK
jgi:hypothetical protein